MVLLTSQETDPQQRPSRSPLSDMGLAKAWKKRDDKLNPSGKQCGNRGSGSKKQLSARPKRCDAPSLFPPSRSRCGSQPPSPRRVISESKMVGGDGERPFCTVPSKTPADGSFRRRAYGNAPPAESKAPGSFDCRVFATTRRELGATIEPLAGMRKEKLRVPSWLGITRMSCSSPRPQFCPPISCPDSLCHKLQD